MQLVLAWISLLLPYSSFQLFMQYFSISVHHFPYIGYVAYKHGTVFMHDQLNEVKEWDFFVNVFSWHFQNSLSIAIFSFLFSEFLILPLVIVVLCLIDRVFSGDCSTRQVYEEGAKEIALSVVRGINCKCNIHALMF